MCIPLFCFVLIFRLRLHDRGPAFDCCPGCSCGAAASSLPTAKNLEVLIYGRQICVLFGGSPSWQCRQKIRSADSQTLTAPIYGGQWSSPKPAAATACRLSLPEAKGTRGACDACLMPALRGPRGSKWIRALPGPLPFLARSRGCVLRRIRSCRASFWWSEGDLARPTEPRD